MASAQIFQGGADTEDVKMARTWTDAYTKANGPESDTVKGWMLEIEK